MAKAKSGSEGKSAGKKAAPQKGGSKSAGSSQESTPKATKTASGAKAPATSTPSKSTGTGKAKSAESRPASKAAEVRASAPAKKPEKAAGKQEAGSARPAAESAQKPTSAKAVEPERMAYKPAEVARPVEPEKPVAPQPAKPEGAKPVPQEVKPVVPPPAPAPSAPAASAPVEKIPQWPDVETDSLDGVHLPVARGKAGVFGGPKDRSGKKDDKLALPTGSHYQYELLRNLNPRNFYCSMRWEYRQGHMSAEEGKRWWANKRILVSANGKSVVVKAVDYGPHENSGFSIGISPGAAEALGIDQGHDVDIKFADQKTPLGPKSD